MFVGEINPLAIILIVVFVLILAGLAYWQLKPNKTKQTESTEKLEVERREEKKSILGTGLYKCIAFRPGNIIDFTTMPKPIGEIYQADTSCPASGGHYIVRELENGNLIDYDPRKVPVILDETPEYAWFSTHWDIVKEVYSVPLRWWQNASTWFAIAMLVILFIVTLVTLGD